MSQREMRLHERGVDLTMRLQLETEGFYLFAKILLDKIARAIEFYFGPAKGCPLDSHDDLVKGLNRYAAGRDLELPGRLMEIASKLKRDISDFRDYQIAHEKSPRSTRGTMWDADGNVRMIITKIYPTERDKQEETRLIGDLRNDIDQYVELVMECVRSNRERSRLTPRPEP